MPTYQRITVAVSPREQQEIKEEAQAEGLSLSAYCKKKILEEKPAEKPIDRISVEMEISELKKEINSMRKVTNFLLNRCVWYGEANKNFLVELFGTETTMNQVADAWERASEAANIETEKIFKPR